MVHYKLEKTNLVERAKFYNNYYKYKISQANIKSTLYKDFETLNVNIKNKIIRIILWESEGYKNDFGDWYKGNYEAYLILYDAFNRNSFDDGITHYITL